MITTTTIDIGKTPAQLSDLLSLARAGTEVIITEGDRTLARLVPEPEQNKRTAGLHPGAIWTSDDFDDPLPDEFWLGEE